MTLSELMPAPYLTAGGGKKKGKRKTVKKVNRKKGTVRTATAKRTGLKRKGAVKRTGTKRTGTKRTGTKRKTTAKRSGSKRRTTGTKRRTTGKKVNRKKGTTRKSRSKPKRKSKPKKRNAVFGHTKEVRNQLQELQELEHDLLNRRSIEKHLIREQQLDNFKIDKPRDLKNYETSENYISTGTVTPMNVESLYKSKSKSKKSLSVPTPYISPAVESLPLAYLHQTKLTPPPAYIADADALEPIDSPIAVFGEGADLSNRSG
jgi:hypothetical protein